MASAAAAASGAAARRPGRDRASRRATWPTSRAGTVRRARLGSRGRPRSAGWPGARLHHQGRRDQHGDADRRRPRPARGARRWPRRAGRCRGCRNRCGTGVAPPVPPDRPLHVRGQTTSHPFRIAADLIAPDATRLLKVCNSQRQSSASAGGARLDAQPAAGDSAAMSVARAPSPLPSVDAVLSQGSGAVAAARFGRAAATSAVRAALQALRRRAIPAQCRRSRRRASARRRSPASWRPTHRASGRSST